MRTVPSQWLVPRSHITIYGSNQRSAGKGLVARLPVGMGMLGAQIGIKGQVAMMSFMSQAVKPS